MSAAQLIYSEKWGAWHRRCPNTGTACGYTQDITRAGLFDAELAQSYHRDGCNRAVPVEEVIGELEAGVAKAQAALNSARAALAAVTSQERTHD